ncbi:MAG: type IV pilus assembly protein PilM [Parcubacteria group bacterium Gr01-1014_48]|nr:MAG: type IV pilus assembly protein PilM [Parcubacteria group bacterium Greene0416_14]TSC73860.1 MAG: type IV pilus assembly protein PilM [Parcubacteria group bacterium Gr01-1014_48]TSD00413.1 MAG: type IV pilus assembly protein PilM [Parcubacteria group bacterium Greene1014_15]TSD07522.1 MAG: type IV pilus assembly protein PilM [Parcubacteria group bacterium Greene0714_4]
MLTSSHAHHRSTFPLSLFPVPKYLLPPIVGLDISDHAIRIVEMIFSKNGVRMGKQERVLLPKGAVLDGDIVDEQPLMRILRELRRKHRLAVVSVSLPAEHAYYFRLSVPGFTLSRKEVLSAIEFRLEESVPVSPQEAIFDYTLIGERSESTDVAVTVMQRKIVEKYFSVLSRVGLDPWLFEAEPEALVRSVIPAGDKSTSMIIDLGELKTVVAIASAGAVLFTAVIETASDALTTAIEKKLDISHAKAESLKKGSGFENTEENKKIYEILATGVSVLRDELLKLEEYWRTRLNADGSKNKPIERVYLCGGGANLKGLPAYLSFALKVEVVLADVWINAFGIREHIPIVTFEESQGYATAVGLALARV